MFSFIFHQCGMRHEEFSFSADSQNFSSSWKRNSLCPSSLRSKNVFCTHGSALLSMDELFNFRNPGVKSFVTELQNQLFSLDHQKGELEKYVFETDPFLRNKLKIELDSLRTDYENICDRLKSVLVRAIFFEEIEAVAPLS